MKTKSAPKKAVRKPAARKPVVRKAATKSTAKKPVAKKPVAKKPVTRKAVVRKPVAKKSVARKATTSVANVAALRKEIAKVQKELKLVKAGLKDSEKREKAMKAVVTGAGQIQKISAKIVTVASKQTARNKGTRRKAA